MGRLDGKSFDLFLQEKRNEFGEEGFNKWRFEMADMIRDKLLECGVALQDYPYGVTTWRRV